MRSLSNRSLRANSMYDLLIKRGYLIDGTGRPGFQADIAIRKGKIVHIGDIEPDSAEHILHADGLIVSPGFIDLHAHSDLVFALPPEKQRERLTGRIQQGITTEIVGNCGLGLAPNDPASAPILRTMVEFLTPEHLQGIWSSIGEYINRLERQGVVSNVGTLIPHGPVRVTAMGVDHRRPSEAEFRHMEHLIAQSLEEGAFGLSFGLIYPPGQYASTDELIRLSGVVRDHGGFVAFHQRGGGPETLAASVGEIVEVGRKAGVSVHHSHEQIHGRGDWSGIEATWAMKEQARREGVDLTQDMIPYTSVCTTMTVLYPPWVLSGGIPAFLDRLRDPFTRQRIRHDIEAQVPRWPPWTADGWPVNIVRDFGWTNIYVSFVSSEESKPYEMKSIAQIAEMTGKDPFDAVSDLVIHEGGAVTQLLFGISGDRTTDAPLKEQMRQPDRMFITDAWETGRGMPHPGAYGAYPRILGRYVREENVLPLEEAIRRMTGLPAGRLGLSERGILREGAWADLVIFDAKTIRDRSTYEAPRQAPAGIHYVLINGELVVEEGRYNGKLVGQVLRKE